jgi:hypothetical protein
LNSKSNNVFDQAVVEILKQGKINPATMDDEKKRQTGENYIAFKSLMFLVDKDEGDLKAI